MIRTLTALLALLLASAFPLPFAVETIVLGDRDATAAETGPSRPGPQVSQVLPAQPGADRDVAPPGRQRSMGGMAGMPGMPGMPGQAAANNERPQQQPVQTAPQGWPSQSATGPGAFQGYSQQPMGSMGGMGMGCMGGMGGMAGMSGMGGMGGRGGMGGMGGTMDQGLAMREVLYIMSLQDALQVITDLLAVQEKLMADPKASDKESLRKELARIKEQTRKISSDYREVLSGRLRGDRSAAEAPAGESGA